MAEQPRRRNEGRSDFQRPRDGYRKPNDGERRPDWQNRVDRKPNDETRVRAPRIPDEILATDLEMPLRAQLKTLTAENAETTARHLVMVQMLIESDPELALRHAQAAASRAGRIGFVRETLGIVAYTAGEYSLALRELLAHRRSSGSLDQIPLIVDSERGLGRPKRALEEGRAIDRSKLQPSVRVNLAIAMSGARLDLGENELALAELEILELNPAKAFDYSVPLFWAYSDTLEILGRTSEAEHWAQLALRAEKAFFSEPTGTAESVSVIEELELPDA